MRDDNQIFESDRWDRYQFGRYLESLDRESPEARFMRNAGSRLYSLPTFAREVFARLYGDPERVESTRPEDAWADKAHAEMSESPDFARLRTECAGDRARAGIAALELAQAIAEKLPKDAGKLADPEPLREQVRGLMAFAKQGIATQAIDNAKADGKGAVDNATAFARALDMSAIRSAIRASACSAEERIGEEEESTQAFAGWSVGGENHDPFRGNADAKSALAKHVRSSSKLRELAKLAGRLKRIAVQKQRSKADHARSEVSDLEMGADLDRLLPSELVKLTDPTLSMDFARGFYERSLLQYRLSGKEEQGEGPIVVCVDESASMGFEGGRQEIWAKAFTMALIQVGQMNKRPVHVIHYTDQVERTLTWEGSFDPQSLLESMEYSERGDTKFEPALTEAMTLIDRSDKFSKADIVFVTDGAAKVSEDFAESFRKARSARGVSCYAVHVDHGDKAPLEAFADKVISLSDLASDAEATELLDI